jgi:hypothetical protein
VRHGLVAKQTHNQQQGGSLMVRHTSLFSQLVALFNRGKFHSLVFRHKAERYVKAFSSWDQFVAMLFCQFAVSVNLTPSSQERPRVA